MAYKLYAVRVFSHDWPRSVSFYRVTIGLPLKLMNPEVGWAEFDLDSTSLAIERVDLNDQEAEALVGRYVGVSIQVDDLHETFKDLEQKGVEFLGPPERQHWGGTLANFKDPDGNILTLLGL